MKHVLAELHELINDLEDQGLVSEASSLQEVFVRVAEDMEDDDSMDSSENDISKDVALLLESHDVGEVLAEIAKQMGGDDAGAGDEDAETSSFAFEMPDGGAAHPDNYEGIVDFHANNVLDGADFQTELAALNDKLAEKGIRPEFPGAFKGRIQQLSNPQADKAMSSESDLKLPGNRSPLGT